MKTFLLFVSGMVTAAILIALAGIFFLHDSLSNVEPPKNVPKSVSVDNDPAETVTITGTVTMPPEIKLYKPTEGYFGAVLLYGPQFDKRFFLAEASPVTFPYKFTRKVPRKEFEQVLTNAQGKIVLSASYSPLISVVPGRSSNYFQPTVMAINGAVGEIFRKKANFYELGEIRFNRVVPQAFDEKCRSESVLLEGKILAPQNPQKSFGSDKLALVIYPDSPFTFGINVDAAAQEFDKNVLHFQYLDFSHGAAAFSAPYKASHSSLLKVMVVRCESGEDLKACALKAFPQVNTVNYGKRVFEITGKNHEIGVCGEKGFIGQFPDRINN